MSSAFLDDDGAAQLCLALHGSSVTSLDLSANLLSPCAMDSLVRLLLGAEDLPLTSLNLACNSIREAGVFALCAALQSSNTTLRALDLSDVGVSDSGCADLGEALAVNCTLQTLSLAGHTASDRGCELLARALSKNRSLTSLDLHGHSLRVLSVGRVADAGASALARTLCGEGTTLQELLLGGNRVSDAGAAALAQALAAAGAASRLRVLGLDLNRLSERCCPALSLALQRSRCLASLDLSHNALGDAGVALLAPGLAASSALVELRLRECALSAAAMAPLCGALGAHLRLERLCLAGNRVGSEGMGPLVVLLAHRGCALRELDLAQCAIGAAGGQLLCACLKDNSSLAKLSLGHNGLGAEDEFVAAVTDMLHSNTTIVFLALDALQPDVAVFGPNLAAAMRFNRTLHTLILSSLTRPVLLERVWGYGRDELEFTNLDRPDIEVVLFRNLELRRRRLRRLLRAVVNIVRALARFRKAYYAPRMLGAHRAQQDFERLVLRSRRAQGGPAFLAARTCQADTATGAPAETAGRRASQPARAAAELPALRPA
jgi:Ran GTPase-activating protein (RanGAP) involved in mRNA processing and transport